MQISNAVAHVAASGSFPIILGGDHSIGFPTVRGLASVTSKRIGIIHVDRHADIQETDLDERMHTVSRMQNLCRHFRKYNNVLTLFWYFS